MLLLLGCHTAPIHGPLLWAFFLPSDFVLFQSQKHNLPCPSPLIKYCPLGEKFTWQEYPATMCPLNMRFFDMEKFLRVSKVKIVLSNDCPAKNAPDGWEETAGTVCMFGSAMYLIGVGTPYSQHRMRLSSDVVINFLPWS